MGIIHTFLDSRYFNGGTEISHYTKSLQNKRLLFISLIQHSFNRNGIILYLERYGSEKRGKRKKKK